MAKRSLLSRCPSYIINIFYAIPIPNKRSNFRSVKYKPHDVKSRITYLLWMFWYAKSPMDTKLEDDYSKNNSYWYKIYSVNCR